MNQKWLLTDFLSILLFQPRKISQFFSLTKLRELMYKTKNVLVDFMTILNLSKTKNSFQI